jgi:ribosome-associated protein
MIFISPTLSIREDELRFTFIHASGPGGQNVNKVATAARLRFNVKKSPSLPDDVKWRLVQLAGRRVTADGCLMISAQRFRTQEQNRRDAINRLTAMISQAAKPPKKRKKMAPTLASTKNRIVAKRKRSEVKSIRRTRHDMGE